MNSLCSVHTHGFHNNSAFALNTDPYLLNYYTFESGDVTGSTVKNKATGNYDLTMSAGSGSPCL